MIPHLFSFSYCNLPEENLEFRDKINNKHREFKLGLLSSLLNSSWKIHRWYPFSLFHLHGKSHH